MLGNIVNIVNAATEKEKEGFKRLVVENFTQYAFEVEIPHAFIPKVIVLPSSDYKETHRSNNVDLQASSDSKTGLAAQDSTYKLKLQGGPLSIDGKVNWDLQNNLDTPMSYIFNVDNKPITIDVYFTHTEGEARMFIKEKKK